jgi:hypothetical protein
VTVVVPDLLEAAPLGAALSTNPIEIAKATAIIFLIISINPFDWWRKPVPPPISPLITQRCGVNFECGISKALSCDTVNPC